ncbi:MAG: hypothetical protein HC859_14610 [Bacteroidia bacterium]|nr:hypothetical protein [Bacteroidia bacterium]
MATRQAVGAGEHDGGADKRLLCVVIVYRAAYALKDLLSGGACYAEEDK